MDGNIIVDRFEHNNSVQALKDAAVLQDVEGLITTLSVPVNNNTNEELKKFLTNRGWLLEVVLLQGTGYRHDAVKNGVIIELQVRSTIDSVHRDFLRCEHLFKQRKIKCLVELVRRLKEPKFDAVVRDIKIFDELLSVPIYLVGLEDCKI